MTAVPTHSEHPHQGDNVVVTPLAHQPECCGCSALVNQLADLWKVPADVRHATNDQAAQLAAAPCGRPHLDRAEAARLWEQSGSVDFSLQIAELLHDAGMDEPAIVDSAARLRAAAIGATTYHRREAVLRVMAECGVDKEFRHRHALATYVMWEAQS